MAEYLKYLYLETRMQGKEGRRGRVVKRFHEKKRQIKYNQV